MKYSVAAAINDNTILERNLADSPLLSDEVELIQIHESLSASIAYNEGLEKSEADVVIFAHQDVYFPQPWLSQLVDAIAKLETIDANWAILGVYGIGYNGEHVGRCWSSGLKRMLGRPFDKPQVAESIDELVIILKKSSGLKFDEKLPGFHLYGTDIVQLAKAEGYRSYVICAPVVHNSKPVKSLAGPYTLAYRYMQKKWEERLPIITPVCSITRSGYTLLRLKLRLKLRKITSAKKLLGEMTVQSGKEIARRLGLEEEEF